MEVKTKLRVCLILSGIALVFMVIALASPGWTVVKTTVDFGEHATDIVITPEEDGLHVDEMLSMPTERRISISFGLWYYRVCKCGKKDKHGDSSSSEENDDQSNDMVDPPAVDEDDEKKRHHRRHHHHHKCYFRGYRGLKHHNHKKEDFVIDETDVEHNDMAIPDEFAPAKDFITTSVEIAGHARHELAWYTTLGLVLGLAGMTGAVLFAKRGGNSKHSGRLACSTQILSAFLFWMAIIRVASYMIQLRAGKELLNSEMVHKIDFDCPWCLWVAAVGAGIMGLTSLFHLILVSRERKSGPSEYIYHTDKKIPIIAPRGYEQLVVPPMYEEGGPLPEKKPIE